MAEEVNALLEQYKGLSSQLQDLYAKSQQFVQQQSENNLVKVELDLLDANTPVFKLVGPVLMRQDLDDAKENVNKRLEFIEGEIKKVDDSIEAATRKQGELGDQIARIQQRMQADAAAAAKAVVEEK